MPASKVRALITAISETTAYIANVGWGHEKLVSERLPPHTITPSLYDLGITLLTVSAVHLTLACRLMPYPSAGRR